MATSTPNRRTSQRPARAQSIQSIQSDSSFTTPRPTPRPPPQRLGRGVRANSIVIEIASPSVADTTNEIDEKKSVVRLLPAHYLLPPTHPSPYEGSLERSLDAIQDWGRLHMSANGVTQGKLPSLVCYELYASIRDGPPEHRRDMIEELLFLLTRTLLPEQIVENRGLMARLYNAKKQLAMRLALRYDMLREWKMEAGTYHRDQAVTVASEPPAERVKSPALAAVSEDVRRRFPFRRPLLPNIIPTLIAAPPGGFTTHGVRERMKHHVTDLDAYLLLGDEEVAGWSGLKLSTTVIQVLLHWQWLRQNNAVLDEMEVHGWEDLEGKADESEWIAEDVKRNIVGGGKRERAVVREEE
ncbi:hypothetical protein AA0111_g9967 [Alternaria arborescens]|uniref:hypothetical protein n=1 Tax=Alternaria arborescens TaxID=156630 RepID=UPI001075350B|nr:hypothetical protein AA0111_g9967 [Alternaria arborescens]RYO20487.1 hypothetical protein AA0111_g9967 [Alternaria arborescens]